MVAALVVVALSPLAAAGDFTDVFFFGDSLTDTGSVCQLLPSPPYAANTCSNGPVWANDFAEALGLSARSMADGGTNYAVGGAETSDLALELALFTLFGEIVADPVSFGLSDVTTACLDDPACAADPQGAIADSFLWFDQIHPTTAAHSIIADAALAAIPEPATAVLAWIAALACGERQRSRPVPVPTASGGRKPPDRQKPLTAFGH